MWHKLYKKVLPFCLAVIVAVASFSPSVLVYGASGEDSLSKDVTEVSDTSTVMTRGNYLNYGSVVMSKVSSTRVLITGVTVAHRVCDIVGVALYLEQSSDGVNYSSYRYWKFRGEDTDRYTQTLELIVKPGYWYRLGGGHVVIVGEDGESVTTMTNGLYVG